MLVVQKNIDKQVVKKIIQDKLNFELSKVQSYGNEVVLKNQEIDQNKEWDLKVYKKIIQDYKKTIKKMVDARMHLGHHPSRCNPKMKPYIYAKRDRMYIIDLLETNFQLEQVSQMLTYAASQGQTFLFVGTQKHATGIIENAAVQCDSFFVNQKWLGGMLTNWQTVKNSVLKLKELEMRENFGTLTSLPKKQAASEKKKKERLTTYLGGLKKMFSPPDVVIIVGQPEELNAVRECKKLGINSVTILDTDCDPSIADLFIPANDDSIRSLDFVLTTFVQAIQKGKNQYQENQKTLYKTFSSKKTNKKKKILEKSSSFSESSEKVVKKPNFKAVVNTDNNLVSKEGKNENNFS